MDWFSWLSRTNLEPCLIHEYSLSFSKNELEHEDIAYFNHEFLQSIGVSIAKHRLEILKLARRERKRSPLLTSRSISRVVVAIKKTSRCVSDHVRAWIRCEEESSRALVLVPKRSSGVGKWRGGFMKRSKRSVMPSSANGGGVHKQQEVLLLTNGTPCRIDSFSSPMVFDYSFREEMVYKENSQDTYLEEIKWDSMFQNLKPT
ncbi:hypothetical protein BRARA_F01081 [Brassica rapa]|uniref:SAM domain-containing protein n=1 Tax=Brassica campestris TaxID=3711 RepID=A0A397YWP7_BRACM|nr:uncharacterized protein LOC103872362 [Brassica rapa]RID57725.1 hypothetical protein BRARA_F01081 [Brassica rapa]CAG7869015.1 unnamed protein product [Brassica rapa]VDC65800.1 unnamed protein product [Brassica rapa]